MDQPEGPGVGGALESGRQHGGGDRLLPPDRGGAGGAAGLGPELAGADQRPAGQNPGRDHPGQGRPPAGQAGPGGYRRVSACQGRGNVL